MPKDLQAQNYLPRTGLLPQEPSAMPMPSGESASANNASTYAEISKATTALVKQREEKQLGAYAVEAQGIIEQTANYSTEREKLLAAIAQESPANREALTRYYQDMSKLRRGEVQGALSPMVASARINTLTKNYINRHPEMALKLRQIHNGLLDDVKSVAGASVNEVDPDEKAVNAVIEEATKNGWSPQEQFNLNHARAVADIDKMDAEARGRAGTLNAPRIKKAVLSSSEAFYSEAIPNIKKIMDDPNFQGKDYLAGLLAARSQMNSLIDKNLQDVQINNNLTLTEEWQNAVKEDALAPINSLIELAEKVDNPAIRAQLSANMRTISENNDLAYIRKKIGVWSSLAKSTQDLFGILDYLDDTAKRASSKGMLPELRTQAKYSLKRRMALATLYGDDYEGILADDITKTANGQPMEMTGEVDVDKQRYQDVLTGCTRPQLGGELQENCLATLAKQPFSFEAWDKRKDLVGKTKASKKVQDALLEASPSQLLTPAQNAGQNNINQITYDTADKEEPFQIPFIKGMEPKEFRGPISYSNPLAGVRFTSPNSRELTDRLNQQYRVFSSFMSPAQLETWAQDTLTELRGLTETTKNVAGGQSGSSIKQTTSTKTGTDGSRSNTSTIEVTNDSKLEAEAKAAGMSVVDYVKWINTAAE